MKTKLPVLLASLVLVFTGGCLSTMIVEKSADVAAPPTLDKFVFDLATPGADAGKLSVQFRQPSYQLSVSRYAVKIDDHAPLVVTKQSDAEVKLDAGKHSLKFYAASSDPAESEKVSFGEPTQSDVVIVKDQAQKLKYTGPIRLFGKGKLELLP